ncbi:uncharacterized protein BKA78DRAFT_292860 [Phyllosticta capitalensis]|uniref:uncharacterized protein n=1 Tax=Phyllosticta capitalensis TaxID=121624 RepID=UPI00312F4B50
MCATTTCSYREREVEFEIRWSLHVSMAKQEDRPSVRRFVKCSVLDESTTKIRVSTCVTFAAAAPAQCRQPADKPGLPGFPPKTPATPPTEPTPRLSQRLVLASRVPTLLCRPTKKDARSRRFPVAAPAHPPGCNDVDTETTGILLCVDLSRMPAAEARTPCPCPAFVSPKGGATSLWLRYQLAR